MSQMIINYGDELTPSQALEAVTRSILAGDWAAKGERLLAIDPSTLLSVEAAEVAGSDVLTVKRA